RRRPLADHRHDRRRAALVCGDLLERLFRGQAMDGDLHGAAWRDCFLRRPGWRHSSDIDLFAAKETADLEIRRCARAQYSAWIRVWPNGVPDERLLLRARVRIALGHSFSRRPRDTWDRRASDAN